MKIVVLMKETPDTEAQIKISADGQKLDLAGVKYIANPYDDNAVEQALAIKEKLGQGEVVVVSFGPDGAKERILKGLAMGADRGVLIGNEGLENLDSMGIAQILGKAVADEKADLVLCGKLAIDDNNMHVGVMCAEYLGWPHVNVVNKMTVDGKTATLEREIEGGQVECYKVELPAVIGADKGLNSPRYTSLPGIMKAKKKPLDQKTVNDLGFSKDQLLQANRVQAVAFQMPPAKPKGKVLQGKPVPEMVNELVRLLREEAKVL